MPHFMYPEMAPMGPRRLVLRPFGGVGREREQLSASSFGRVPISLSRSTTSVLLHPQPQPQPRLSSNHHPYPLLYFPSTCSSVRLSPSRLGGPSPLRHGGLHGSVAVSFPLPCLPSFHRVSLCRCLAVRRSFVVFLSLFMCVSGVSCFVLSYSTSGQDLAPPRGRRRPPDAQARRRA